MFTEYHVIKFILHCLMGNIKDGSAQTAPCAVRFGTEQYHSTNCLKSSLQLTTPIITLNASQFITAITNFIHCAVCTVNCAIEQYHSTDCLQSSLQLTTPIITLTHIAMYYCHN